MKRLCLSICLISVIYFLQVDAATFVYRTRHAGTDCEGTLISYEIQAVDECVPLTDGKSTKVMQNSSSYKKQTYSDANCTKAEGGAYQYGMGMCLVDGADTYTFANTSDTIDILPEVTGGFRKTYYADDSCSTPIFVEYHLPRFCNLQSNFFCNSSVLATEGWFYGGDNNCSGYTWNTINYNLNTCTDNYKFTCQDNSQTTSTSSTSSSSSSSSTSASSSSSDTTGTNTENSAASSILSTISFIIAAFFLV